MHDLVTSLAGKRVLVVGDVMLDEYIWGAVRRVSPEAPVPVVETQRRTFVPGGAANAANNVVSLGGRALLGGVVGADAAADHLRDTLRQQDVRTDGLVVEPGRPTTCKTRVVAHHQQIVRVDHEQRGPLSPAAEQRLLAWVEETLPAVDACILSDYGKGVVSPELAGRLLDLARRANRPVVVDPKGADCLKYRGATVVKPNLHEAERFTRTEVQTDADLLTVGGQLLEMLDGTAVLITRGAHGMSLFRAGRPVVHIPSVARDVFDVTGAGDTVIGTLALALAAAVPLERAADLANRAAGVAVSKVGTAPVTHAELVQAVARAAG